MNMGSKENKLRVNAWLTPNMKAKMESLMSYYKMKNHTEFMELAVDFYIGYLDTKDASTFLSKTLLGAIDGTIKQTENRHSNNIFRLAVEMSMMMNLLAYGLNVDDSKLEALRGRCVKEVKNANGRIAMEDAVAFQKGDD